MHRLETYFFASGLRKSFKALLIGVVFALLDLETLSFAAFVIATFTLVLYKKPKRYALSLDGEGILSPIDGKLVEIKEKKNHYKLFIESNLLDCCSIFAPIDGKIVSTKLQKGTRLGKDSVLFKKLNEKAVIKLQLHEKKIKIKLNLKRSPYEMELYGKKDQILHAGETIAFACNALVEIEIPKPFRLDPNFGDKLKGAQTILGYFDK